MDLVNFRSSGREVKDLLVGATIGVRTIALGSMATLQETRKHGTHHFDEF